MNLTRRRREAGQALVEFGLVFVVFVIVAMGIIDVSRAVWNYNTLSNAVREGARYGIVHGSASTTPAGPTADNAALRTHVLKFAGGLDANDLTISSTWPDGNNARGSRVRVTASYEFDSVLSELLGIPSVTMSSTTTMNITN